MAFRGDGAPWIWERLEWVTKRLGLKKTQVSYGLDWCHAVHHVSLALETLDRRSGSEADLQEVAEVVEARGLAESGSRPDRPDGLGTRLDENAPVWTEINYLERHGEAGRLDYAKFRRRNLPVGSGAIESAIRRVINLRMKGNSIFLERGKCGRACWYCEAWC